jgi:hypothetical protein
MPRIVDLSVPIGEDTISPPSVNSTLTRTRFHRGPGFWQASSVNMDHPLIKVMPLLKR